jgi:gas vesicle protein
MSNDWTIFVVVGSVVLLMLRFDRLGKQLEAVCANIKSELAPSEDRRREILSEWKEAKDEAAKEARQQWIGAGIVGALLLGWYIITRN